MASKSATRRRGPGWLGLLGLLLSLALLWWVLHDVSLREVWHRLRQVHVLPFLGAVCLATAAFPLRAVRWRYILRLEGAALPLLPLWHATAIGFMANNLLPARAGELARAYAARRMTAVRFTAALASIAAERVLDGIVIVALLAAAIWAGGFSADTMVGGVPLMQIARGTAVVFAALLAAVLALVHWPDRALAVLRAAARRILPDRWAARILDVAGGLLAGMEALRSPKHLTGALLWTVAVWTANAASFWLCFLAFDLALPATAALLVQGLIAFGVALPSSPGFFGPFEAACRVSLGLYGVAAGPAVSYAVGYHFATFIPITLLGLWSLSRAHLHLADLRAAERADE